MKLLLLSAVGALLIAGCDVPESSAIAQATSPSDTDKPSVVTSTTATPLTVTNAVVAAVPAPAPDLPPNLPEPAREIVKLAHGQMGDGVLTNFIANIKEPFHLDADQIVYLRDLGLSPVTLESLLTREQELARQTPPAPPAPAASTPTVVVATINNTNAAPVNYPGGQPDLATPQVGPAVAATPSDAPPSTVNYNFFYDSLSPYGNWFTVPSYGYVWQPSCAVINPGWRPYWNDGCWNWCDSGWYWNSSYSWGWAPFHYGNWVNSPGCGWCWVPGQTWAPSWVTFRSGGGYCGWAPLPPGCGWSAGVGLTWAGSGVSVGFGFGLGASAYCWTPTGYFAAPNCHAYGVYGAGVNQIYNGSTVINNYVVGNNNTIINNGIDPAHIAPYSRSEIRKVQLADVNSPSAGGSVVGARGRPGDATRLAVYRPTVGTAPSGAGTPAPRSEIRPTQFASRTGGDGGLGRIPTRETRVNQPDRLPAPNPRTPAVGLHSSGSGLGGTSPLTGRSGEVRPGLSSGGMSSGVVSRPGNVRTSGGYSGPGSASRGDSSYSMAPGSTGIPSGRLEPRKSPSISTSLPGSGVGNTSPGVVSPRSNLSPQVEGARSSVGSGRQIPGSTIQPPIQRYNPRPSMSSPTPSFRTQQTPQIQRMQAVPPSVNMSRPIPSYNPAPAGGGTVSGGGLQRPGRQ